MDFSKRDFLASMAMFGAAGLATNAVAQEQPVPQKNDDSRFNVKDFGAKGDGVTPDSAAIQAAMDAAAKVNGTVWFPAGKYLCHNLKAHPNITLLADPVWIYHTEQVGAVLLLDSDECDCLLDITGAFAVHIRGLLLDGSRFKGSQKKIHGIFLNNPTKFSPKEDTIVIDDTKVQNFSGHGIYLLRIWLFIIRHSQSMGNVGSGIQIFGWDGFVTDNQLSGNGGHGFGTEACGATVMFTANRVEWNRGYGLYLCGGDAWNVTGNSFDRNWGAGLCALNMSATAVTGNLFRRCGKDSHMLAEGEQSCHMRLENCNGISVCANTFAAGRDDGGQGKFTPQVGFIVKKMSYSVVSDNSLFRGFMDKLVIDQGEHGPDFIFKDNVGCPAK